MTKVKTLELLANGKTEDCVADLEPLIDKRIAAALRRLMSSGMTYEQIADSLDPPAKPACCDKCGKPLDGGAQ